MRDPGPSCFAAGLSYPNNRTLPTGLLPRSYILATSETVEFKLASSWTEMLDQPTVFMWLDFTFAAPPRLIYHMRHDILIIRYETTISHDTIQLLFHAIP